jgi:penicillin V acylase-like amidase (Ntn superfamily)
MSMKRGVLFGAFGFVVGIGILAWWSTADAPYFAAGPHSCATFLLAKGGTLLVGHNLDDAVNETPGMILINKRGVRKESISYKDLNSFSGRDDSVPRISWVSTHGSVTYNVFGREFPDGGMNEAGLYVGEMTLLGSVYPTDPKLVKMYHHAWLQYLLDNFTSVPEVLESLAKVTIDGHCQWHFFVADRAGRAAVVEFDEGRVLTYTGENLPVRVSTNYTYPSCLKKLAEFEGFGGTAKVDFGEKEKDRRFIWAAAMIRDAERAPGELGPDQAFKILEQMWCGANRWSLVFDPVALRVWFTTDKNRKLRWLSFSAFDFTCRTPALALDIQRDIAGDVASQLVAFSDATNLAMVKQFFSGLDVGIVGNMFWKGRMVKRLNAYQQRCKCP